MFIRRFKTNIGNRLKKEANPYNHPLKFYSNLKGIFLISIYFFTIIIIILANVKSAYAEQCNNILCLFLHPSKESFLSYLDFNNIPPTYVFGITIFVLLLFGFLIYLNWRMRKSYRYY